MDLGAEEGRGEVYDDRAQLILAERERIYARRGLTVEAFTRKRLLGKDPLLETGLWYVYYTNQRVVGLRDPNAPPDEEHEELYAGTLRAIDRTRYLGPKLEDPTLRYFQFALRDIDKVKKRGRKHLRFLVDDEEGRYEFRFRPWGAACRFFSVLLRKEEQA